MMARIIREDRLRRLCFSIPGRPVPAPRPSGSAGGKGYYRDPGGRYDAWKGQVAAEALNALGGQRLDHFGAVILEVRFGRERTLVDVRLLDEDTRGRADVDNLAKGVMDALEGIIYLNDRQVVHLDASKEDL